MIFNGSDALLGIATFIPDKFRELANALRDGDDNTYFKLATGMEFLGRVAFQPPVPAYKHGAAMVKQMRGWYPNDDLLPNNPFTREEAHREELRDALHYLGIETTSDEVYTPDTDVAM